MLGDHLRFYTDSVVIGRVLGIVFVTPFSVAARLMFLSRQILLAVASPLMGVMGELDGQSRQQELKEFLLRATRTTALLSLFLGSMLFLNGKTLIRLWVGESLLSSYPILLILLAGYVLALAQQPSADVLIVKARHRLRGWWTLAEGMANLLLSIYWARRYGLIGVALGTAVPMLVAQILIQPWYALRVVELSARRYVKDALARPAIACAIFLAFCRLVDRGFRITGVIGFVWTILWETVLLALLACTIVLTAPERQRLFAGGQKFTGFLLRVMRNR
jgi:O-antigen/teichoic acid export membrane protein